MGFILAVGFFPTIAMAGPLFFIFCSQDFLNSYPALIFSYLIYALPIAVLHLLPDPQGQKGHVSYQGSAA